MAQSPFETLPEEVVMSIAAHLGTWHAVHKAFVCTTRAARFDAGQRGHGVRSVFLRYFSAYISVLERYQECLLNHILSDVVCYAIPPPGGRLHGQCIYAAGHFDIKYTEWTDVFDHLQSLYHFHCQRIIGNTHIPCMFPRFEYPDCLRYIRQFRHMYENGAITMFQLCFGLHQLISTCGEEARVALSEDSIHAGNIDNICAADVALASWIHATPILADSIQKFSRFDFLGRNTAISLPQTYAAVVGFSTYQDEERARWALQLASLQGSRPGCATCFFKGQPCNV